MPEKPATPNDTNDDTANDGNEGGNNVQPATPAATDPVAASLATVAPTGNDEVDKLVKAALAEVLPKALQSALAAQQQEAARAAAENAAREQGDYKTLFERSEVERKTLELDKWRGEALTEAGLDVKWFDSIQGTTKDEMVAFAKKFKKNLDDEVKNIAAQTRDESPGTPRGGGKGARTRTDKQPTGAQKTGSVIRSAFGVHTLPRA